MIRLLHCCGMGEMHGVGHSTPAEIMKAMIMAKKFRMGLVMATTNNRQKPAEVKLKALGFKCFRQFKNPNTGSVVKVWFKSTADANVKGRVDSNAHRPDLRDNYLDEDRNRGPFRF